MNGDTYTDEYERIGEFHDLFVPPRALARLGPPLKALFGDLPGTATVLDIGAGTGLSCRTIAEYTSAQIVAIEPSLTMRSALLARIGDDAALKHRVSVLAEPVPAALNMIDHQIEGFVCSAMLGHLSAGARTDMLRSLGNMLSVEGAGLLTVPVERPPLQSGMREDNVRIGAHEYIARYYASPDGEQNRTEYEVRCNGETLRRVSAESNWRTPDQRDVLQEAEQAGLTLHSYSDSIAVVRKPTP
ncbi:class I SAM-dependent methyltransferase [Nesterenkonia haasae]|uniref:class I SAM-dependent methyltransferase n=1 Tax=Nesterenkonia haasae TaxID=2587813 RepID=UPI001391EAD9|nr:class I SAM-dependent methyltransferase [Nesterenkonia haasae]